MEFASARRELGGWQGQVWRIAAICFVLWHMWALLVRPIDPTVYRALHVFLGCGLALALFAPSARAAGSRVPWYDAALILLSVLVPIHYVLDADGIEMRSFMGPSQRDFWVAGIGMLVLMEFTRRVAGIAMPLIAIGFIAYVFVGPWMPGIFYHRGVGIDQALSELFNNNGVLGEVVQVSATFIIMFVVFAAFLQASKAGDYLNDVALAMVGWARGGPAKVTVISGAMFGAISGSSVANVVASGTFTIPMMRRVGYNRHTAAAVEATSSTGGQITPPVMGAGAFIMAETIGMPYIEIAIAAIIPAFLFYVGNYAHCDLHARRNGLHGLPRSELPRWSGLIRHVYMISPLVLLVWMMMAGYSPFRAAGWGIAATLAIMIATMLVHAIWLRGLGLIGGTVAAVREFVHAFIEALVGSSREVLQLIAVCATAGIIAGVIGLTGIGGRFATTLLSVADASALLAMIMAMIVAMILGLGVPTTAAYVIAAAVVAPGLIKIGVAPLVAHMFIFFYAVLSAITPPVAVASFAAAGLAGADMWRTSITAVRLGAAIFLVPFMFWLSPALLAQGPLTEILFMTGTATIGVILLATGLEGWFGKGPLPVPLRVAAFGGGLCLMIPGIWTDLVGVAIGGALWLWQRSRHAAA